MLKENEATTASLKKRVDELMIMLGAKDFEINELKTKLEELEKENKNLKSFSAHTTPSYAFNEETSEENSLNQEETTETIESVAKEVVEEKEAETEEEEIKESAVKYIKADSLKDDISKYGAKAISNISLKAAMLSNTLALSQNENSKDLLTLTLGRSEVFKQKVFEVTKSAVSFDTAKASINLLEAETIEYFEQLKAQL